MTANPNSAWGCQARKFIQSIARNASGDDAEREQTSGWGAAGQQTTHSVERTPRAFPAGSRVPGWRSPAVSPAPTDCVFAFCRLARGHAGPHLRNVTKEQQ